MLKYLLTIFSVILVPAYWRYYGVSNFLWLSDIGLFLTVAALWLNSTLLMSIAAVGVLAVELAWCIDFFLVLVFKLHSIKLADYMLDTQYPRALRALSLFHCAMPIIWISYFMQHQYDTRALFYFIVLYWLVLCASYFFTDPRENINYVFLRRSRMWFFILCAGFPLFVVLPTHFFLKLLY